MQKNLKNPSEGVYESAFIDDDNIIVILHATTHTKPSNDEHISAVP